MLKLRKRWAIPLAVIGLGAVWSNQPWFGYNLCQTKGIMHETDFVEEMRPIIMEVMERRIEATMASHDNNFSSKDAETTRAGFKAIIDAYKRCAIDNGIEFCRYVGPDEIDQIVLQQDQNEFVRNNQHLYIHVDETLPGEFAVLSWDSPSLGYQLNINMAKMNNGVMNNGVMVYFNHFPGFGCRLEPERGLIETTWN